MILGTNLYKSAQSLLRYFKVDACVHWTLLLL